MPSKDEKRWERLAALGVKREIPTPEGEAKMSAVNYLAKSSDPDHKECEMSDWRGPCRPEHFDAAAANKAMWWGGVMNQR